MTQMEELNKLLIKFKLQLKQKGITQQIAAEQLNITRSHLNKVINKRTSPSLQLIQAIERFCDNNI